MFERMTCRGSVGLLILLTVQSASRCQEVKTAVTPGEPNSKAARLVLQTQKTLLQGQKSNYPQFALGAGDEKRAFEQAIHVIANTRIPKNFLELERRRPKVSLPHSLSLSSSADPNASSFDWRKKGKSTPIRDQMTCGCCWCFAAVAAYEGNHLIKVGGSGDSLDVSEQEILNCGNTGGCNGDWYMTAWEYMKGPGTSDEQDMPYEAAVKGCNSQVNKPYHVAEYGLVSETDRIPSVKEIKQALCKYGPLAVAVEADQPFLLYEHDPFEGFTSDANTNPNAKINHAVTIVGWNDPAGVWIIKNQWSTDWGTTAGYGSERGYMRIKYNSNNIGYAAAWCVARD
jgi:cathepsin L